MSDLSKQIAAFEVEKKEKMPEELLSTFEQATEKLKASGIEDGTIKNGEKSPLFTLNNHLGEERSLDGLIAKGPVVLNFYRGGW